MGTPTANLGIIVPQIGGDPGPAYAQDINQGLTILDAVLGTPVTISVAPSGTFTLTAVQMQAACIVATGALTGNSSLQMPAGQGRLMMFQNATTGSGALLVSNVGGSSSLTIPQGQTMLVYTDGTTPRFSNPFGPQEIASGSFVGVVAQTIPLSGSFSKYRVHLSNVLPSVNLAAIGMQFSINGGATVGPQYAGIFFGSDNVSQTFYALQQPVNQLSFFASGGIVNTLPPIPVNATYDISPGSASTVPMLRGTVTQLTRAGGTGATAFALYQVSGQGTAGPINAIRIVPIDNLGNIEGTISGSYIVEGLP